MILLMHFLHLLTLHRPTFQVQHRLPLHDDVHADRAGVLPAAGLGGEDCPRRHSPTRFLRDAFIRVIRKQILDSLKPVRKTENRIFAAYKGL